jgi:GNAT superfamily N-acetyltransferase
MTVMSLRIAPARPQDVAVIVDLVRQLAAYEKLAHLVVATEAQVERELFCEQPVIECVIGWDDGAAPPRAVGFALYFPNFSTFLARRGLYLEDLFVVPEARGRGYGKALITHLARLAVSRGCGRFEWSVLDWNQPAIDFYRALGADLLADWRICRLTGPALDRLGRSV